MTRLLHAGERALRRLRLLLLARRSFERDLDDELRFHLDMAAERHAAAGHSPVVLAAVAMLATIVPAWKATRVDPVTALRAD